MKEKIRRALKYTAFVAALPVGALVFLLTFSVAVDLVAQGRIDRAFYNELCRGIFYMADSARLQLGGNEAGGTGTGTGAVAGTITVKARNLSGAGVGKGRAMMWRSTPITVVSAVGSTSGATATVVDNLVDHKASSESLGSLYELVAEVTGTAGASDSIVVVGWDASGTSQTKRQKLTQGITTHTQLITGTGRGATKLFWTKATSVSMSLVTGTTTVALVAYPIGAVAPITGLSSGNFAGVTVDSLPNNAAGKICVYGPVDARVNGATSRAVPGTKLTTAGWGVFVTAPGAVDTALCATAMEYASQDSLMTRVKIGRQ